jgi:predicted transcriptional regulator of viral defense system
MLSYKNKLKRLNKQRFGFKDFKKLGLSYYEFRKLISEGLIEKVARGVYQKAGKNYSEEDNFITATSVIGKPCAICMLSALEYYKLTDHIAKKTWLMVSITKRTSVANIRLFRRKNPKWNIGVENKKTYSITNIERTLVETIVYRSILGSDISIAALKKALKYKKTTLDKIWKMAGKLGFKNRIKSIIEAFI